MSTELGLTHFLSAWPVISRDPLVSAWPSPQKHSGVTDTCHWPHVFFVCECWVFELRSFSFWDKSFTNWAISPAQEWRFYTPASCLSPLCFLTVDTAWPVPAAPTAPAVPGAPASPTVFLHRSYCSCHYAFSNVRLDLSLLFNQNKTCSSSCFWLVFGYNNEKNK